jgi:hypothetical protein
VTCSAHPSAAPLVSIALCTYNGERFLPQQLDSLLSQTHANLEIVASDDGSTDATPSLLERYAQADRRIRVVANAENLGFAGNFARALSLCRGDYIAPCDQDDVWLPEKISALLAAIGERALAYCDSTLVNEEGAAAGLRMSQVIPMLSTDDPAPFAFGNCVSGHAMLFRKDLLARGLPTPPAFFYDWWIAAVAAAAGGVVFCDRSLVMYRQHGGNITSGRLAEMVQEAGLAPRAVRPERVQGGKLLYLRETEQRLAALAQLPGEHRPFVAKLHGLWRARETQWLSPALGVLMLHHGARLLAATNLKGKKRKRYCREFFWGLKSRRLLNSRAYRGN